MMIVGRKREIQFCTACIKLGRHVLLEGPVGVGKSKLAQEVANNLQRPLIRIDADDRYTADKLIGYFDPVLVLQSGYQSENFVKGPLCNALEEGAVLLINEFNRLPISVQNILLPVLDESFLDIPRYRKINSHRNFIVIATQNTADYVGVHNLSEAVRDRIEVIPIHYQNYEEEFEIVTQSCSHLFQDNEKRDEVVHRSLTITRNTRNNSKYTRGASVRAAIAIAQLSSELTFEDACKIALLSRVELADSNNEEWEKTFADLDKKKETL